MKTKEFIAMEKRLLPSFPGFAIKGSMMFILPLGHTLRGFDFDASGFNKRDFYVNMFFMPLYVPKKYVHFTFGHRIKHCGWNFDMPNLDTELISEMQKDVPFLMSLQTYRDVARAMKLETKPNARGYVNPHCYEALAYSLMQAGDVAAAMNTINILLKCINSTVSWECEIGSRSQLIKSKLLKNPDEAKSQLAVWEEETVRNLGFEDYYKMAT